MADLFRTHINIVYMSLAIAYRPMILHIGYNSDGMKCEFLDSYSKPVDASNNTCGHNIITFVIG